MTDLHSIQRVYFLGAGGIGMSALARYFNALGKKVAGYDRSSSALTDQLIKEGIAIHFQSSVNNIPPAFLKKEGTLIIYTPALPANDEELTYFRKHGFTILKRAEMLGLITRNKRTIAIAGTHGKTTVTTMIAWILQHTSDSCNAFLGGISKNFNSNLVLNAQSERVVVEADEYDRSFLRLHPYAAVITAMDADHLDIYGNIRELYDAFNEFASQISPSGFLVFKKGLPVDKSLIKCKIYTYSVNEKADFYAGNVKLVNGSYVFDINTPAGVIESVSIIHPGMMNVENAVAAAAVTKLLGCNNDEIKKPLSQFTGNLRRFDYILKTDKLIFIDDYAHHPKEIEATLLAIKELYPGRRITGIFQPHLYSRTKDLAVEFAQSLSLLDELIMLDIYPAREKPIKNVTSELILRQVTIKNKMICRKEELLEVLKNKQIELLVTMGAGDIDQLVEPIKKHFQKIVQ
jgi:UDP-N-acetylmuramate--alanine ligase